MKSRNTSLANGFTLIEILILLGLFAILASIGLIMGVDSIGRSTVHNERDTVVLLLQGARARALANVHESAQGVRLTPSSIILYEGASYPGANARTVERNNGIVITDSGSNTTFDIIFAQLSGSVGVGAGTVTFSDGAKTSTLDINGEGRLEW